MAPEEKPVVRGGEVADVSAVLGLWRVAEGRPPSATDTEPALRVCWTEI